MEGYNFVLSEIRLFKRIRFKFSFVKSLLAPLISAFSAAFAVKSLFVFDGSLETPLWLIVKLVFTACAFFVILGILTLISDNFVKKRKKTV
jgi:hypothetical protein